MKAVSGILLVWLLFTAACSATPEKTPVADQRAPTPKKELKTDIPNVPWVKIFFEGFESETLDRGGKGRIETPGGIDEITARYGFSALRETVLPENDLEARVWVGFGKYGTDGFILRRSSGDWSAAFLKLMLCHDLETKGRYDLPPPKSGWEATWQRLVEADILILPDSSKLKYPDGVIDGKSYVVETNSDFLYRAYEYGNPQDLKFKEAGQIMKIGRIIAEEFGLESFSSETGGCSKNE